MKFDLAKTLKHQLVLLAGDEGRMRREALSELIKAASDGEDFDLENFVGDSSHPQQWFASAGTAPFLSPRRTAVVRNVLRFNELEEFKPTTLPDSALVLLVADEESGDENKWKKMVTAYSKAVEKANGMVVNFTMEPGAVAERLRLDAKDSGKELSPRAAEALKEMCGEHYSRARDELDKLIAYVGAESTISEDDVKRVVTPSREWNVYKLSDAALQQNPREALRQLDLLLGSSKSGDAAYRVVLPTLSRQMRLFYQARLVLDLGGDQGAIPPAAREAFPAKPNLTQEKEYPRKLAFQGAKKLTMPQIQRALTAIADCDARLKGQLPGIAVSQPLGMRQAMEGLVFELLDALAPVAVGRR